MTEEVKARSRIAWVVAVLAALAALVCGLIGVWTHGHDGATRWAATAGLMIALASVAVFVAGAP